MDEAHEPLERAFEELVELVLRGEAPDLEAFLADRTELDEASRARLRVRARVLVGEPAGGRLPFERVGEFRLVRKLGEGGMGVVYLARQESLGRLLALKVMRPELVGAASAERRFEREARAIAQLRHPGIVTVHATGEHDGVRWLALEYIEGRSLDELLRAEGRIAPARAVRWARELAEALAYAHGAGVVHRDVKPSNVRIDGCADGREDGRERALLVDFGLAQLADASALTASGAFRGTPYYASPEQVEGRAVDGRTDVYSLGATLYQCLTGVPPFEGATSAQVFHAILAREPRAPRALAPELARDLETVVLKAMEKDPSRRYASAAELAADLDALLAMRPIRARPQGALTRVVKLARRNRGASVAAAVAVLAVLAALGSVLRDRWETERRFDAELAASRTAAASGDHDSALRALERALSLRPGDGGVLAERERVRRAAAAAEAQASVARARTALASYRDGDARLTELTAAARPLRQAVTTRPMSAAESARLLGLEEELAALGRTLESHFAEVLEALNLARGLDPENAEGEAVLAELYLERWRAATNAHDARGERHYRALVEEHDRARRHSAELNATVAFTLASTPAGAEVFLFRYEEQSALTDDGEPRLVPVPVGGDAVVTPGRWALRVVAGADGIEPEDLVLSVAGRPIEGTLLVAEDGAGTFDRLERFDRLVLVDDAPARDAYDAYWLGEVSNRERAFTFARDGEEFVLRARKLSALAPVLEPRALVERGGVPIEVFRRGRVEEREAPAGLVVRTTAAPLLRSDACLAGTTPLAPRALAPGSYVALVCKDGFESVRVPFVLARGHEVALDVALLPLGTSPPGFVRVPAATATVGGDAEAFASLERAEVALDDFWIQEREVGVLEYLEFVNDPETLTEIDASPQPIRVPRDVADTGGIWKRLDDGTFEPPAHTRDQPVHAISWHDATAYARWLTAHARTAGSPYEFALPTELEWERAARGADARAFVFGEHFVPRWVKGFFARDQMLLEPSLRFPIDESVYGAFDLTGNLWEWCADEWQGGKALRGGGWNFTFPAFFRAASRAGQDPEAADGLYGFRLVARRER